MALLTVENFTRIFTVGQGEEPIGPTEGGIASGDRRTNALDPAGLRALRARIQSVFQNSVGSLDLSRTLHQTVDEPTGITMVGQRHPAPATCWSAFEYDPARTATRRLAKQTRRP